MPVRPGPQSFVIADEQDQDALQQVLELFNHAADNELTLTGPEGESYRLTGSLQHLLHKVVEALAEDKGIALRVLPSTVPVDVAATILNVSSEYVQTLISDEHLSAIESTGALLIPLRELLAYRYRRDADRDAALSELTRLSEELGLYE